MIRPTFVSSAAGLMIAWSATARADLPPPVRDPLLVPEERIQTIRPNTTMMGTGLTALGLSYIPSAFVAGISDHAGDRYLFIPVAGPWIDLARRGCAPDRFERCGATPGQTLGLMVSGAFQLAGLGQIVASLIIPEQRAVRPISSLRLAPVAFGYGGYGAVVGGAF